MMLQNNSISFKENEIIKIENVFVQLRNMIPADQKGILGKIVKAENIISNNIDGNLKRAGIISFCNKFEGNQEPL